MKKLILTLLSLLILCPQTFAASDMISMLTQNGFFEKTQKTHSNPYDEIKKTLCAHLKFSNSRNIDELKKLYSEDYINSDGLNKEVYFDLIKKTWASYPDIKYSTNIISIDLGENQAVATVNERAYATTDSKTGSIPEKGVLESLSNSVYYFEKRNGEWKITSDRIDFEKTSLRYGSAQEIFVDLTAPCQTSANTPYTAKLTIKPPKDSLVIASVGKEDITYPQSVAPEVFRKLPETGTLERIMRANNKNINEYAVASFGITKAEIKNGAEIKIYITGLGFVMTRVNVVPINTFVKVEADEQTK